MCAVEGIRQKTSADLKMDNVLNNEETLDVEKVWNCIDLYHDAICKTRGFKIFNTYLFIFVC